MSSQKFKDSTLWLKENAFAVGAAFTTTLFLLAAVIAVVMTKQDNEASANAVNAEHAASLSATPPQAIQAQAPNPAPTKANPAPQTRKPAPKATTAPARKTEEKPKPTTTTSPKPAPAPTCKEQSASVSNPPTGTVDGEQGVTVKVAVTCLEPGQTVWLADEADSSYYFASQRPLLTNTDTRLARNVTTSEFTDKPIGAKGDTNATVTLVVILASKAATGKILTAARAGTGVATLPDGAYPAYRLPVTVTRAAS